MQVDAVYENGKITLLQTVNLKSNKFKLKVSIPDEEVESEIDSVNSKYYEIAKQKLQIYRDMILQALDDIPESEKEPNYEKEKEFEAFVDFQEQRRLEREKK
ncbi:MAG: hypothetical protein KDK41_16505 [Leptospiraceae bacterium]|nr:hypothetical protein [Leptospiraceae bacterium]